MALGGGAGRRGGCLCAEDGAVHSSLGDVAVTGPLGQCRPRPHTCTSWPAPATVALSHAMLFPPFWPQGVKRMLCPGASALTACLPCHPVCLCHSGTWSCTAFRVGAELLGSQTMPVTALGGRCHCPRWPAQQCVCHSCSRMFHAGIKLSPARVSAGRGEPERRMPGARGNGREGSAPCTFPRALPLRPAQPRRSTPALRPPSPGPSEPARNQHGTSTPRTPSGIRAGGSGPS